MTSLDRMPKPLSEKKKRGQAVRLYQSLEKQLLDQPYAQQLADTRNSFEPGRSSYHNTLAGWLLAESALINTELEVEDRLILLDSARSDWEKALEIESNKPGSQEMHEHYLISPSEIKLRTSLLASEVFGDLIQGNLKQETRDNYYENLLYLGVKAAEGYEYFENRTTNSSKGSPDRQFIGVSHEMNALLILARLKSPSLVCTPSLLRADSGQHFPRKTHDLQVLNTKWGSIRDKLGIEVKTTPRPDHFDRYDAVLIGGTLHLHPDKLRDPVYLTELLVKDHKGMASEEELSTINAITDNVVHSIRHGFRGTPQCREITNCQEITDHKDFKVT